MSAYNSKGLVATGSPGIPMWLTIVRIAMIVFSLGALIAAGYNLSLFNGFSNVSSSSGPCGFIIFDAIFTWLVVGFMLVTEFFAHKLHFRIAFIVGLGLLAIFWLSGWAWAASWASDWSGLTLDGDDSVSSSLAAAAALGAFTWILVLVTLGFYIKACLLSHDGHHAGNNSAELGQVRHEPKTEAIPVQQQQQYPVQQQQQYPVEQQQQYPVEQQQPYPPAQQQQPYPAQY